MRAEDAVPEKLPLLFVTFERGAHGPWRWLEDVLAQPAFAAAVDAQVWEVADRYRGLAGKWRLWRDCARRARARRPVAACVVHDLSVAAWVAPMLRVSGASPVLVYSNATRFEGVGGRVGAACRRTMVRLAAHRRLAVSADAARAMFGGRPGPWRELPAAIDFERLWRASEPPPMARSGRGPAFGVVGRLDAGKNPLLPIRALGLLCARGVDAQLWFVGDGPMRAECESLAQTLGIGERVHLPGATEDIGRWYRHVFDAVLVPSLAEGQGRTVAEAQAFGLPVLVSAAVPDDAALDPRALRRLPPDAPAQWADAMAGVRILPTSTRCLAPETRTHPRLSIARGVAALLAALGQPA